ncbi:unnamed protein product [Peniophora sp. CBMAI 1063]|nr:unnamed protein product [Peniophora sp. CBMAI 1063]
MASLSTYISGSEALSSDQSMREYREALESTANRLAMAEREKAYVLAQAQNAMDEAEKNFKTQIEDMWGQLQEEKKNAQQARTDLQDYIIKAKEENKARVRAEKELAALQTQCASQQELISSLQRTAMADKDEIQALKDALALERRKVGSQGGAEPTRDNDQPQTGTTSGEGTAKRVRKPRGTKRPADDHNAEPASTSRAKKRVKASMPAETTQTAPSHEGQSVSDPPRPSSGRPSEQPVQQASSSSSSPAKTSRGAKLSIKHFVTARSPSIWDKDCRVDLPPLTGCKGDIYEMGDIVSVKDPTGRLNGLPSSDSDVWHKTLIGVLCNYSTHGLCTLHGEPTCLRSKFGEKPDAKAKSVAVAWIMSQNHIEKLFAGRIKSYGDMIPQRQFEEATWLREHFFDAKIPSNQRFPTALGVEWVNISDLDGLVSPIDIGTGASSHRPVVVDWKGPALCTGSIKGKEGQLVFEIRQYPTLKLNQVVPKGWVIE